jgi:hypothetical protein
MQTRLGLVVAATLSVCALQARLELWEAALAVAAALLASRRPGWRTPVLLSATWLTAFLQLGLGSSDTIDYLHPLLELAELPTSMAVGIGTGMLVFLLALIAAGLRWIRKRPHAWVARQPFLTLLLFEISLAVLANQDFMPALARVVLWSFIFSLMPYIWYLPAAITDLRAKGGDSIVTQLGTLRPFWSPAHLPFGKGAAFLRKHLARNPRELAITQLKALKLLLWANVLIAIRSSLTVVFEEYFGIPSVASAMDAALNEQANSILLGWFALVLSTAKFSLQIAIWAHLFVGIARLAGYRLPRGSWRPLESRTLIEYFNRFHYYFKELLVDLFFLPTFMRAFRSNPRLRVFFATFMAAGVGNAVWHFMRDLNVVAELGFRLALESFSSYAFYCLVLAIGISISHVRANAGFRPGNTVFERLYSFLSVWGFVVCLHAFSDGSRNHTLLERLSFVARLFGVSV